MRTKGDWWSLLLLLASASVMPAVSDSLLLPALLLVLILLKVRLPLDPFAAYRASCLGDQNLTVDVLAVTMDSPWSKDSIQHSRSRIAFPLQKRQAGLNCLYLQTARDRQAAAEQSPQCLVRQP